MHNYFPQHNGSCIGIDMVMPSSSSYLGEDSVVVDGVLEVGEQAGHDQSSDLVAHHLGKDLGRVSPGSRI